jgi:hypothetical protein
MGSVDDYDHWVMTTSMELLQGIPCDGPRLYMTEDGSLGLGPAAMKEGDHQCILFGATVPFVLPSVDQSWKLVGECYVKALMGRKGVEKYKDGKEEASGLVNHRNNEICESIHIQAHFPKHASVSLYRVA